MLTKLLADVAKPASVAQLNALPSGDQEVAGSIPSRSGSFFHRY